MNATQRKVYFQLFSRDYSQSGAALGIVAGCAAFGARQYCAVLGKCGAGWMRPAWGGMSLAGQSGTLARAKELGRGVRCKRKRVSFSLAPHWLHVGPCCAGGALAMAGHYCAENLTGGKLDAALRWGAVIHTTRCRGGTNCHERGGAGAASLVTLVVW